LSQITAQGETCLFDALYDAIGFEHEKIAVGRHFYHSAVIARACNDRFAERKIRQKLVE